MREYIAALETHLAEAHRQAVRLVKRQATLGSSLAEFGTAMIALGKCVTNSDAPSMTLFRESRQSSLSTSSAPAM